MSIFRAVFVMMALAVPACAFSGRAPQQGSSPVDRLNSRSADGSPTLKETSDWLQTVLLQYGGLREHSDSAGEQIVSATIDNACNFSYLTIVLVGGKEVKRLRYASAVPLGSVSEVTTGEASIDAKYDTYEVRIKTGNIAAVHSRGSNDSFIDIDLGRSPQISPGAPLPDSPDQMAPRIQKALQHAVQLCSGTYNAPAQTKQPF